MESFSRRYLLFAGVMALLLAGIFFSLDMSGPTGLSVTQLVVVEKMHKMCFSNLSSGTNLFSVPCFGDGVEMRLALEGLNRTSSNGTNSTEASCSSPYRSVFAYEADDLFDPWKVNNPCLPSYVVDDLNFLDDKHGYFIDMIAPGALNYSSDITIPNIIQLKRGYNLVGYPANDTIHEKPVLSALSTINTSYLQVFSYSTGAWLVFNGSVQQFSNITPFKGYWVQMGSDDEWEVDW